MAGLDAADDGSGRAIGVALVGEDPLALSALAPALASSTRVRHLLSAAPSRVLPPGVDVVVWDLGLDPRTALDRHRALLSDSGPGRAVIALVPEESLAAALLAAGARGVLDRGVEAAALVRAVEAVAAGLVVLDPDVAEALVRVASPTADAPSLTAREREVLELLAQGLANKAIAERLGVTDHTAKFHVNAILAKLGASSRTDAVVRAARAGLLLF